jgi:hypothetical protein
MAVLTLMALNRSISPPVWQGSEPDENSPTPRGRVQLLGIAQRTIHTKFSQKCGRKHRANSLINNIKTIVDWIKVKPKDKNLTPGRVAAKMGIAHAVGGGCEWVKQGTMFLS